MFDIKEIRKGLLGTTALISAAMSLMGAGAARAGTVSTARVLTYNMVASETLTITNAGSISNSPAINIVGGITVDGIENAGTISGTGACSGCTAITINNSDVSGGIVNSGLITATSAGRIFTMSGAGADISGGVTNTGTINADSVIFNMSGSANISGDIVNDGTMSGGNFVLLVNTSTVSGDVINKSGATMSALTVVESVGAAAVISGDIINSGNMTGTSYGIRIRGASELSGDVINEATGKISGGNRAILVQNAGAEISGSIVNKGTIEASTMIIEVQSGTDISGGITNSGTIQATGTSSGGAVIRVNGGAISGGITNTGTIDGTGIDRTIDFTNLSAVTPLNINGGRIIGTVIDNTTGTGRSPVTVGGTFESEGNFTVSSFDVNSDGNFTFGNGNTINSVAAIGNAGTMNVLSGEVGTVTNDLTNAASGTVNLAGTLTVGGTFTNTGTLAIAAGKTATVTNALTNNGNTTIAPGATLTAASFGGTGDYTITITDDGDDTLNAADFGSLASAGAIDLAGEDIVFNFSGYSATGAGVVLGAGGAPAVDAATVTDNSLLYDASLSAVGNDLQLTVTQAATIDSVAGTSNKGVGTALEAIRDAGTNDATMQSILGKIAQATTAAEVDAVLESVGRPLNGDRNVGSNTVASQTVNIAMQRLGAIRSSDAGASLAALDVSGESGIAAGSAYSMCDDPLYKHVWGQAFGQVGNQDTREGFGGYDSHTYGVVFGADTKELYDDTTLGVAVSYGRTEVDSDNANNIQTQADTYQFSVYGDHAINDRTRIDGIIGFSWSDIEMDIYDIGGVPNVDAHGEFAGQQFSAQLGVSRDYPLENGLTLTPGALMNYIYYHADNYQETGAGDANQIVESTESQLFEIGAELEVSGVYQLETCSSEYMRLNAMAGVRHDLIGDKMETTAQFAGGGGSFKTYGYEPAQTTYNAGIGFKRYSTHNSWEFTGKYDLEFKEDFHAHGASLRAGYRF